MTLDMINDNMNNNNPALHPQQRRMIDLFMVLYGSFRWDDVAAKTRVRDRAVRANLRLQIPIQHKMSMHPTLRNKNSRNGCYFREWSDLEHRQLEFSLRRERMGPRPLCPF
jgi:hypothetical protein